MNVVDIPRLSVILFLFTGLLPGTGYAQPPPEAAAPAPPDIRTEAQSFLDLFSALYRGQLIVYEEAEWQASIDVSKYNDGARTAAGQAYASLAGNKAVIETARSFLERRDALEPLQVRQLEQVMFTAARYPGTIPDVVNARVAAEARQSSLLDGYRFCLERGAGDECLRPVTANDIDRVLVHSSNLDERLQTWEASKEIGRVLKPGLAELIRLRNEVARELGYTSYFHLKVAEYGMTVDEMMALLESFVTDMQPLYTELMKWTSRTLAERYGRPAPEGPLPAHWAPNRWAQSWEGIVPGASLDPYFEGRSPEWIMERAESFYTSMGFEPLPESFWAKSDLYPVPKGEARRKNSHASAWHLDLERDVRSLMSVEPTGRWFFTAHHELGHIYYYLSYSRPEVPYLLRKGANRGFHEGIGELIAIAAGQRPYLEQQHILPENAVSDEISYLLNEALEQTVTFIPWSAGTMSHFEHALYEEALPPEQWQRTWWSMVERFQGVGVPDTARLDDEALCDACSKTHINDDPAEYYDYAIATVLKYQLHETIARKILAQDPHRCNYYGSRAAGEFLQGILELGATRDWREVLREATGEELSTRAMMDYYKPLHAWLIEQNSQASQ